MNKSKGIALAICLGLVTNCGIDDQTSKKADAEIAYFDDGGMWGGYGLDARDDQVLQAIGALMLVSAAAIFVGPKVTKIDASGLMFWKKINYKKAVAEAEGWRKINIIDDTVLNNIKMRAIISHPSKIPTEPTYTPKLFKQSLQKFKAADNTDSLDTLLMQNSAVADFVINQAASLSYLANNVSLEAFEKAYAVTKLDFADAPEAYRYFKAQNYHLHWIDPTDASVTLKKFRSHIPNRSASMDDYFKNLDEMFSGIPQDTNLIEKIRNRFKAHSATSIANTRVKLEQEMAEALKKQLGVATDNKEIRNAMNDLRLNKLFDDIWATFQTEAKKDKPKMDTIKKAKQRLKERFYDQKTTDLAGSSEKKRQQWYLLEKFFKIQHIK